jgi:hypothetical protein
MKSGHRSEILRKHFAMPGFERLHEVIDCVLGFALDVFQLHDFFSSAVSGSVFSFTWSGSEKKQAGTVKGQNGAGEGGRARVAARGVTNRFWFTVWRDTGVSARATDRAAAKRRPPTGGEVERQRQSPPLIGQLNFRRVHTLFVRCEPVERRRKLKKLVARSHNRGAGTRIYRVLT